MLQRSRWLSLLVALCASSTLAQDGVPLLNSAGRFFGVGWSRRGYHAAGNGQLRIVRARHPSNHYASGQLAYPYSPNYQPMRPGIAQHGYGAGPRVAPAPPSAQAQPENKIPPGPIEPPPEWLKRYLDDGEKEKDEALPPRRESLKPPIPIPEDAESLLLEDTSPSDRLLERPDFGSPAEDLAPPPSLDERIDSELAPMEDDELLLDDDDDMLLLDDITQRRRIPTAQSKALFRTVSGRPIYLRK